jgi:hypothetical protein
MFYPFTAPMASKETLNAKIAREGEMDMLLQAYLSIAHVCIQQAARAGHEKTSVYCPYLLREDFWTSLSDAGFEVSKHQLPNRYWVSWGEF